MLQTSTFKPIVDLLFMEIHLFPKSDKKSRPSVSAPLRLEIEGPLRTALHGDFSIDGIDFYVGSNTFVVGVPRVGAKARATLTHKSGRKIAQALKVLE